jgi:hypothetical protein
MNRYQRRKRALKRKEERAELLLARAILLKQNVVKEALKDVRLRSELLARADLSAQERAALSFRKREPKLMGFRTATVWHRGLYLRGFGTGAFSEKPLSERSLRELKAIDKAR